jgi:hypothetical protein
MFSNIVDGLSEEELTNRLISKDVEVYGKRVIKFYKSTVTGKEYEYGDYANHGYGGIKNGYKDLPLDEYPYTFIYETIKPIWMD